MTFCGEGTKEGTPFKTLTDGHSLIILKRPETDMPETNLVVANDMKV